jgi:hypothetical protein
LLAVGGVAMIATVATFLCNALRVGPPGGYMIALACATGTGVPVGQLHPLRSGLLVLAGGAFAWLVHMSGILFGARGPERVAVAAGEAVARFVEAAATSQQDAARYAAAQALDDAWTTLVAWQPAWPSRSAGLVAPGYNALVQPCTDRGPGGRGDADHWMDRHGARPGASILGHGRGRVGAQSGVRLGPCAAARPSAGDRHPSRTHPHVGCVGAASPGDRTAATLALLQFIVELWVVRNYGVAVMFITANALIIASAGHAAGDVVPLLWARGLDTAIGCAVGLAVFVLATPRVSARWIPSEIIRTLEAVERVVRHLMEGALTTPAALVARRDLQDRAIDLQQAYDACFGGSGHSRQRADQMWPAVMAIQQLAYRTVTAGCSGRYAPGTGTIPAESGRRRAGAEVFGQAENSRPDWNQDRPGRCVASFPLHGDFKPSQVAGQWGRMSEIAVRARPST